MHKRDITIVMATSVITDHPNTKMIDQAINDIRVHFPDNEIILAISSIE